MYNELLDSIRLPLITARDVMEYVGYDVPSADEILAGHLPNFVSYGHFQDSVIGTCERMAFRAVSSGSHCYAKLNVGITGIAERESSFYGDFVNATVAYVLVRNGFSLSRVKGILDSGCLLSAKPLLHGIATKMNETYSCILINHLEDVLTDYLYT